MKIIGATSNWKKKALCRRERLRNAAASIKFGMPLNAPALERPVTTHVKYFGKNGTQTELF
jgi:hypothetical protein